MIYYFVTEKTDKNFYDICLEAWQEIPGVVVNTKTPRGSAFQRMEKIYLYASKDRKDYQVTSFRSEFGKDSCVSHSATTAKALIEGKTGGDFNLFTSWVSREDYEGLRSQIFDAYQKEVCIDFEKFCEPEKV